MITTINWISSNKFITINMTINIVTIIINGYQLLTYYRMSLPFQLPTYR